MDRHNDISWTDAVALGSYSREEMKYVTSWIDAGMKIINRRSPYDSGDPTRFPVEGSNIAPSILSDRIELIAKIERKSLPKISDHQMLIIRSESRETWVSLNRPSRDTREELNCIAQIKFAKWDESDICR